MEDVPHEGLGELLGQRLVGQQESVVAGAPELVDENLGVSVATDLAACLGPLERSYGKGPARFGVLLAVGRRQIRIGQALARARTDLAQGRPVRAMTTFFRDVVGLSAWSAWLAAAGVAVAPAYRRRVPGQVADLAAIDALGDRRSAYGTIVHPMLGIWGTTSPAHLGERMRALLDVVPEMAAWQTAGDHAAANQHPREVAAQVLAFLR